MLKAVLFDMDGTITRPHIDWAELRQRLQVPAGVSIMDYIESLPPPRQEQASAVLEAVEMEAATEAALNPGAAELLVQLCRDGLRLALITNNHRRAMQVVVEKFGLDFDLLLSREDAPLKPAPDLLLLALERFGCTPAEACFVGDGRYDRVASEAAGVFYIHLDPQAPAEGLTVPSLGELRTCLREAGLLDGTAGD
ncbi:MAG: HAD-IA family hydrolase [Candidatus Latescibacteria bacterium]|nr:HAD-IA family hydrolase [Candidatus Latescibacterota bacterium]